MTDKTETIRRQMVQEINGEANDRIRLTKKYGEVFDTSEVQKRFSIEGFMAPFVVAIEKATEKKCTLMFQDNPRFYWFDRYC